jgi:prophage DNA circulation protein
MKKLVVLTLAVVALVIPATQASAAPAAKSAGPTMAQFKALQKQVTTLQKSVKSLKTQVTNLDDFSSALVGVLVCENAVIADAFQGTWNVVDQIATATQGGKTYFGSQSALVDKNACSAFKITRSQGVPPNAAVFNSLISLLTS